MNRQLTYTIRMYLYGVLVDIDTWYEPADWSVGLSGGFLVESVTEVDNGLQWNDEQVSELNDDIDNTMRVINDELYALYWD